MTVFGIGFGVPWLLWGLAALPILWILLRAVPPAPIVRRFPAVALLLGLEDRETTPDRTPWWLLLLRCFAIAAAILAFAQPILNPESRMPGKGPLLLALDASWASAQTWTARHAKLSELARQAQQDGRSLAVIRLSDTPKSDAPFAFGTFAQWQGSIDGLEPQAWEPEYTRWQKALATVETSFETVWFSDGLNRDGRDALFTDLSARGAVQVVEPPLSLLVLHPARIEDGVLKAGVVRLGNVQTDVSLTARGPDPAGISRDLATVTGRLNDAQTTLDFSFDLPSELRNRVRAIRIDGLRSAGAVTLTDDSVKRRKVALAGGSEQEGAVLVSPLHFLRKALEPTAEVIEAGLADALQASPDVVVLADVGKLPQSEVTALEQWVEEGGLLLRFAGPQLAAAQVDQREEDPLLPVRLRAGGRSVGGAMSWGAPKKLNPFPVGSPFEGLEVPPDVEVRSQVMAQPGPELADRVFATLVDGTPLVTGRNFGKGKVVLVHVSANAEWSDLPLSGLFVQMLERLAISARTSALSADDLEGLIWVPERVIDGFGRLRDTSSLPGVEGSVLATAPGSPELQPGLYRAGDRRVARNVVDAERELAAAIWPAGTEFLNIQRAEEVALMSWLLIVALGALLVDIFATLLISGRLLLRGAATAAVVVLICPVPEALADEADLLAAANNTVLAYVTTGDRALDEASEAGLLGLSSELYRRTSIEPIAPIGIDIEADDLSLYPFLYWPVSTRAPLPSDIATAKLNAFLARGGLILFDTRDANISSSGGTPNGRRLQQIAARLVIPRLEPVPSDHVLTRAFYLLQDFPGRYARSLVWVEAAPADVEQVDGMPFRNLNDGVTPVVVGGNDWAKAWAIGQNSQYLYPVGRGSNGERQREMAYRFGINLIMHTLTGNYKSDQVHVPALLDRLGQ